MLRVGLALLFGMLMSPLMRAQSMAEAGAQLADLISSLLQRRATVSLEFQNLTTLAPAESSSFRAALQQELRKTGVETTTAGQSETLRVTISENVRGLLFVAAVSSGENRQVAMLPWSALPPGVRKPRVKLSIQPMLEQSEPVLDTLLTDSASELLVLSPTKVASYRMEGGKWTPAGIAGVTWTRPLPRDPRGRLENASGGFRVFVPGTSCSGTVQPELKVTCAPGNDSWPLNPRDSSIVVRWVTDRNVLDGSASELSAIENPCGPGWMMLGSAAGNAEDHDQLQAYDMGDGQAVDASDLLLLPGPVTALWPSETPGQSTLVVHNLKTGNYEASRLGVACAE
jgi:hypothetical protein